MAAFRALRGGPGIRAATHPSRSRSAVGDRARAAVLVPLLLLVFSGSASAQEEDGEQRGWRGTVDFGLTLTEGNSETTSLSAGAGVVHRLERHRWTLTGSLLRSTSEGEETANRGTASAQYDFFPVERFFFFGRVRAGYNRPAGLTRRLTTGVGAGYSLVETDLVTLSAEGGSSLISETFQTDGTSSQLHATLAERLTLALGEDTQLVQSLEYQPKFEELGDFLAQGEVALTTRLVGGLGLRLSLSGEYDSDPFVDEEGERREKLDLTFITGLAYEF